MKLEILLMFSQECDIGLHFEQFQRELTGSDDFIAAVFNPR
jgi:hypothetical protein